ncbi:cilia- and flagella-associated protein 157 isoform X2 [Thunnus albacares]|uniref:cilia- and flagella-associated protein 157 isoform X2 n=1 Tax=Thunnus albacares TaxID=8236 RepID=UPI001CF641E0|nr:cilia- and flagella-associated protein 157 isoform X2 [Thunnus albacares]
MEDIISSEDRERSLYLKQIQYLDEQLERCQLKCGELEKENKKFVSQYKTLETDKNDIIEYLKHSKAATEKEVEKLSEQLESQQKVAEQDREALKMQHSQLTQELQDQMSELNSQSAVQALKFEAEKEQLMSDIESLKEQQVIQKEEHEAAINSLKEDAELERENVMYEVQDDMEISLQERISYALQKERAQHEEKMERLQFLLRENVALLQEKDRLQWADRDLRSKIDRLKETLSRVQLESLNDKTELEQLMQKCQWLSAELHHYKTTSSDQETLIQTLRQDLTSVSEQLRQKTLEADQLGKKLREETIRKKQLETDIQDSVVILRHILEKSEWTSKTEQTMQRLLEILESSALEGIGCALYKVTEPEPPRKLCSQKTSGSDVLSAAPAAQREDSAAEASTSVDC